MIYMYMNIPASVSLLQPTRFIPVMITKQHISVPSTEIF